MPPAAMISRVVATIGVNRVHIASMQKICRSRARCTRSSASASDVVNAFSQDCPPLVEGAADDRCVLRMGVATYTMSTLSSARRSSTEP